MDKEDWFFGFFGFWLFGFLGFLVFGFFGFLVFGFLALAFFWLLGFWKEQSKNRLQSGEGK